MVLEDHRFTKRDLTEALGISLSATCAVNLCVLEGCVNNWGGICFNGRKTHSNATFSQNFKHFSKD